MILGLLNKGVAIAAFDMFEGLSWPCIVLTISSMPEDMCR